MIPGSKIRRRSGGLSLQALFPSSSGPRPPSPPEHTNHPQARAVTSTSSSGSSSGLQPQPSLSTLSTSSHASEGSPSPSPSGHSLLSIMSSSSRKSSFTIAALPEDMTFLDQDEAASIDADLRDEYGFLPGMWNGSRTRIHFVMFEIF